MIHGKPNHSQTFKTSNESNKDSELSALLNHVNVEDKVIPEEVSTIKDTNNPTEIDNICFDDDERLSNIPAEVPKHKFYYLTDDGAVVTHPHLYATFFEQENFIRISTNEDRILILKDTNNVVDYFNHNSNIVAYLKERIEEAKPNFDKVANAISKQVNTTIKQGFLLMSSVPLTYYKDSMQTFGLPFKNGFFRFDANLEVGNINYKEVKGFFTPHPIQQRSFTYTEEVGDFESFFTRIVIGQKECSNDKQLATLKAFKSMLGYMSHNHKNVLQNPCIILSDDEADDETRNGRRGKSLIAKAIQEVQPFVFKGGKDLKLDYNFSFDDLDKKHNVYIIDDVPANFHYEDLYTFILGDINCQRKGHKAELIQFEDSPKFLITTNWVVPYDKKNASTNKRFLEYKLTDYYNAEHSPIDEFSTSFFQGWDNEQWNRFYSFIFRCVKLYLMEGLIKVEYDKEDDNFKAYFNNDVVFEEFDSTMKAIFTSPKFLDEKSFSASDFLNQYKAQYYGNNFHHNNIKKFVNAFMDKFNKENNGFKLKYSKSLRKWVRADC